MTDQSTNSQPKIQCSQDIARKYEQMRPRSHRSFQNELYELYNCAIAYAKSICYQVGEEWRQSSWAATLEWYYKINNNVGWKVFGTAESLPFPEIDHFNLLKDWTRLGDLLSELTDAGHTIEDVRLRCILDYWLDLDQQGNAVPLQFSMTDSCDMDDDDDSQYLSMRTYLYQFQNDSNISWTKTEPIFNARMRKDVRAWARVARYGCMKLSCNSMLIHKNKQQIPRRRRYRLRNGEFLVDNPGYYQQSSVPGDTNAIQYKTCDGYSDLAGIYQFGLPPNELTGPPVVDLEQTSYPTSFDQDPPELYEYGNKDHESAFDKSIWQHRKTNNGYSSGGSNGSRMSMWSNVSHTKKRRLPRNEDGYPCDFLGCFKTFDRQCDLRQHKRSHEPKETLPYPCELCDKRFPYPKDLKRHEKACRSKNASGDL